MPKPHPIVLRERVIAHVEAGHSHRKTASHFCVSVKFVNDMVILKRETGSLEPRPNSRNTGHGKLAPHKDWIRSQVEKRGDITVRELCFELKELFNLKVNYSAVWQVLHGLGFSHKKRLFMPKSNTVAM